MNETIINTISVAIALSALILTLYQIYSTQKHNYLGVQPYLKFGWTASESDDGIWMINVGLGTAVVNKFRIKFDGKFIEYKTLAEHFVNAGYTSEMIVSGKGATVQVKDKYWLIRCKDKITDGEAQEEYWSLLEGMEFYIEYESLYKKKQQPIKWICPNPIKEFVSAKPKKER